MTIDYNNILSSEQKRSIVSQRISQLAAELYQHSLNKKAFENIAIFASNLKPAMTIEQAISSLLEQGFNPIYNPKKVRLLT